MKDMGLSGDQLLAMYDRVAGAEDAIPRLRRFVLDLAVRGKLVAQDAADEPASELLKRIEAEKARLVKAGEIKAPKVYHLATQPEHLGRSGWAIVPLGMLINNHLGGGTPSKNNHSFWDGEILWASVKDVGKTKYLDSTIDRITDEGLKSSSSNLIPPGNLIVVTRMGLGQLSINRVPVAINQDLRAIFLSSCVDIDFIYNFFLTNSLEGTGLTVKGIKLDELMSLPVPLPPLAEQKRIVAKVAELMGLLDQLEQTRVRAEGVRARLTTATWARLTTDAGDAPQSARHTDFALQTLPALTTTPAQIKTLRQTILNLAVRGKLVAQDPNDEPASVLLERVAREIPAMRSRLGLRPQAALEEVDSADAPFNLPAGWSWARFPEVGVFARGKSKHRPRNDVVLYRDGTIPFVQTGDVARSSGLITTHSGVYNEVGLSQSLLWPAGTMCITIAANIADSGILTFDACFPDSVVGLLVAPCFENARYFEYFVRTAKANLTEFAPATAQKNINLGILETVLIPLPPLAEQHRIVAKVDALMALCDQLETALTTTATTKQRLLDTLIRRALSPDAELSETAE